VTDASSPLLEIENLVVNYGGPKNAVDHISLNIALGETLGLVGESGSGKSSVARAIVGLAPVKGGIRFEGKNLSELGRNELRSTRSRLQMIFQDPYSTLDPRMRIGDQISEPLLIHGICKRSEVQDRVVQLLERVELESAMASRYPHEFSGGQRQRIAIARVVGLEPRLIVCDEPTSALDVSVQAQILKLLSNLQRDQGLTYLFIAHNLAVVRQMCHRVAVMYLGQIVEMGTVEEIFDNPQHDYTKALLDAVLEPDPASRHIKPKISMNLTSPEEIMGVEQ
jgi:ABC-type oligopeptide transport system ATPase subunit